MSCSGSNFECLDLQTSDYLGQGRVSRSWSQGQDQMSITKYTHLGGL